MFLGDGPIPPVIQPVTINTMLNNNRMNIDEFRYVRTDIRSVKSWNMTKSIILTTKKRKRWFPLAPYV